MNETGGKTNERPRTTHRRLRQTAIVALGIGVFGATGLSGALAQTDDAASEGSVFGNDFPFEGGVFDEGFLGDIFGDNFPADSGSGGGEFNVGGSSGGSITVGGGGGITIGGGTND